MPGGRGVKSPRFAYARPETLQDALALLAEHGGDAAILAGGQSLMPMLALRMAQPGLLIDINRIPGLSGIATDGANLVIGARTRHAAVLASPLVRAHAPLLSQALEHVAHPAIRNRGTLGGSLALADPAAELPACAVCLDARVVTVGLLGERAHPADGFFQGLYATALVPGELVVRVEIPLRGPDWRFVFQEVARRHGDFAIAGVAVAVRLAEEHVAGGPVAGGQVAGGHVAGGHVAGARIAECRIATCGVEPAPRRLRTVEAAVVQGATLDALRATLAAELDPMSSAEAPAFYRRHLGAVLLDRALRQINEEAAHAAA
jgi:carbon-monoxide dehydrogenase medium subunit